MKRTARTAQCVAAAAAVLVLSLTAACGGGDETGTDNGESLTLSIYPGPFAEEFKAAYVEPFSDANPSIKVKVLENGGSEADLALLRTSKSKAAFDVGVMDINYADVANRAGLFAPLDPAIVTNLTDIDPLAKVKGDFGPGFTFDTFAMLRNKKTVEDEPASWDELWDPKYKGRVVMNSSQLPWFLVMVDDFLGANYKETIDPAVDRLKELAPSVSTWTAQPDPYTYVVNESADIGMGYNGRAQYYVDQNPGKLGVSIPEEGSALQVNTINMPTNSSNKDEAQKFINYVLSPEAQRAFAEAMYYGPTNTKTKLDPAVARRVPSGLMTPDQVIPIDYSFMTNQLEAWNDIARREIVGG